MFYIDKINLCELKRIVFPFTMYLEKLKTNERYLLFKWHNLLMYSLLKYILDSKRYLKFVSYIFDFMKPYEK